MPQYEGILSGRLNVTEAVRKSKFYELLAVVKLSCQSDASVKNISNSNTKNQFLRSVKVCTRMEEGRGVHKVLVGKHEGKRPLGRPRRRWEDNIKMDLQEVGRGCGDWDGVGSG